MLWGPDFCNRSAGMKFYCVWGSRYMSDMFKLAPAAKPEGQFVGSFFKLADYFFKVVVLSLSRGWKLVVFESVPHKLV